MYSSALVLNRNYMAVHVTDWKKAVSLLFQGHAEVVDEDMNTYGFEDWVELSKMMKDHPAGFVHSVSVRVAVPEVIKLVFYDRLPKREVKFTKRNIYAHYGYKCCYCGNKFHSSELNLDHVIPRSRGGKTCWTNIVTSCVPCNSRKADRTPREAGLKLLVKPTKPRWKGPMHHIAVTLPVRKCVAWQKLIDSVYWDGELNKN